MSKCWFYDAQSINTNPLWFVILQDDTVGIDTCEKLYHAAMHPKSFLSLDGADHFTNQ
jgi:hypothetical protein